MRLNLRRIALSAVVFSAAAFANLTQTPTIPINTRLNLDTGATPSSGGDLLFTAAGLIPQGSAIFENLGNQGAAGFNSLTQTELNTMVAVPGALTGATIPFSSLVQGTLLIAVTNGGNAVKLLIQSSTATSISIFATTFENGPAAPTITAVHNNSSGLSAGLPNYGITPSSIFAIVGTNLANTGSPVLQDTTASGGLPLTLNGASVSVTVNGVTVHPAIYYTSPNQIAAVLPASTPIGTGTVTVTYNSTASNAEPILVVPAALGINFYYSNSAVATDAVTGALLTYTNSGTPGENIVLWTTGLGADPSDSDTAFTSTPHAINTPLQIYIGGVPATILYQGSSGYPGVDQINVTIPASTPNGCWTGVAAVAAGVLSNIATIPVMSGGGVCVDTVNGLSGNQLVPAANQSLKTGLVAITQTNKAGTTVYSSNSDAAFEAYNGIYSPSNPISPGGCIVNQLIPVSVGVFSGLDPGGIQVTGPNGLSYSMSNQLGIKGAFSNALPAGVIPQTGGTFTFTGRGGADVGSFTSVLNFSNPLLSWTNPSVAASIDRTQNLTVNWTGGNPGSYVFVTGSSTSKATSTTPALSVGFTCLANAGDGKLTVPSYILSALPAGSGGFQIQNDLYVKLSATGLDIGVAQGEIGISAASTYK